jgi:signal transduction histidine kinase
LGREKQEMLLSHGYRALLAVRLMVKDKLFGGLTLYYTKPREFSAEDAQLAVTVADHAALAIENARLRASAQRSAVVAERSRIARDLHDSVTQTLFSAKLIAEALPKLQQYNPEEGTRRAEELRQLTRGALAEMRTLLLELRPATLAQVDIDELLRQLVDAAAGRARIPIELRIEGDTELPADVKTVFFSIAQEALNNVAKHARATQAAVHLTTTSDAVRLSVSDDGVGFEPFTVTPAHLGLTIMRERMAEIAGRLVIESEPGEGTRIVAVWQRPAHGTGRPVPEWEGD